MMPHHVTPPLLKTLPVDLKVKIKILSRTEIKTLYLGVKNVASHLDLQFPAPISSKNITSVTEHLGS